MVFIPAYITISSKEIAMKKQLLILVCFCLASSLLFAGGGAQGKKFPSKQINVLVGASPGGTSDITARTLGKLVEKDLGVPVVVNNKPGGSSAAATEYMCAQPADGYTLMYVPVENAMIKPLGLSKIEPKDLTYIARAMTLPATVTVKIDAPWKDVKEFIEYAKAHPGELKAGNSGPGSIWHFAAVGIEMATGVKFNHVPFDGGAAAATAVMGGHVDLCPVGPGEVKPGVDGGKLKVLAIAGDDRNSLYPGVPSMKELGYDVKVFAWGCIGGPAGLPADVLKILETSYAKAIQSQEWKDMCAQNGWAPAYLNAADAQKFAEDQAAWYQKVIPTLNLVK